MTAKTPPRWAEAVLRAVLAPRDRDTVSGDLLEEYRMHVVPARGQRGADWWYLRQVAEFVCRSQLGWAIALSAIFIGRTVLDWLVPTTDFYLRATVTTYASSAVLISAGAAAAWRTHSVAAGAIAGASVGIIAAGFEMAGAAVMLGFFHDSATLAAAEQSGGIGEVFTLPILLIVPATVLGLLGGVPAAVGQGLRRGIS
jgi:hypothetical protein